MSDYLTSKTAGGGARPQGVSGIVGRLGSGRGLAATFAAGLVLGLSAVSPATAQGVAGQRPTSILTSAPTTSPERTVDVPAESASNDTRQVLSWVIGTADNAGMPFVIVDKKTTEVFVFDAHGRLLGSTSVLIGLARGDDSAAGIGDRKLADIRPDERTTPAGRFVASLGHDLRKQEILWVDYNTALALHRVLAANTKEHRLQRLATTSPLSHRITFGCINVPEEFYENVVHPAFSGTSGIVYILPEIKSIPEVFFASAS